MLDIRHVMFWIELTLVLSDRRLGISHRNTENVLILKGNDKNWSERERNKIVEATIASSEFDMEY